VDEWSFTLEEAFVFVSVACDLNICQACHPSPFSTIARVAVPKTSSTPRPFA
jgi:amidase